MKILSALLHATILGCRAQLSEFRFKGLSWIAPKNQEGYYAWVTKIYTNEDMDLKYVFLHDSLKNKCIIPEKNDSIDQASVKEYYRSRGYDLCELSNLSEEDYIMCPQIDYERPFRYPEDANYESFILPTGEGKIDRTKGKWVASIPVGNQAPSGLMSVFTNSDMKVVGEIEYKDLPQSVVMPSDGTFKLTLQEGEEFEGEWQ